MRTVTCGNCNESASGLSTWHTLATSTLVHDTYCNYHLRSFEATQVNPYDSNDVRTASLDKGGNVIA